MAGSLESLSCAAGGGACGEDVVHQPQGPGRLVNAGLGREGVVKVAGAQTAAEMVLTQGGAAPLQQLGRQPGPTRGSSHQGPGQKQRQGITSALPAGHRHHQRPSQHRSATAVQASGQGSDQGRIRRGALAQQQNPQRAGVGSQGAPEERLITLHTTLRQGELIQAAGAEGARAAAITGTAAGAAAGCTDQIEALAPEGGPHERADAAGRSIPLEAAAGPSQA